MGPSGGNGGNGSSDEERMQSYQQTGEYTPRGGTVPESGRDTAGYDPGGPTNQVQTKQGEILDASKKVNLEYAQTEESSTFSKIMFMLTEGAVGSLGKVGQPIYRDEPLQLAGGDPTDYGKNKDNQTPGSSRTTLAPGAVDVSAGPSEPIVPVGKEVQLEGVQDTSTPGKPSGDVGYEDMRLVDPMFSSVAKAGGLKALFLGGPGNA